ncbi:MAG: TolC family protein [Planctomycetes bacterium]|nr:TolC family protein [Planctomycetota bacterium]
MHRTFFNPLGTLLLLLLGCGVPGEKEERSESERQQKPFIIPHGERVLPNLGNDPSPEEVLHYAFHSNARIEQAFFEWKMALERVPQMSSAEDPRLSFDYLFSKGMMSKWNRTTLGASQMIPFPGKLRKAGQVALEEAIAARRRFEDSKFMLQADVIEACQELLRIDASIEIAAENLRLLKDAYETTLQLLAAGKARQAEVTKSDLEAGMADNLLRERQAQRPPALAKLNALISRPPSEPLSPRAPLLPSAPPPDEARIIELAAERNKELEAMAAEVRGRENALDLAQKAYFPDLELSIDIRGSMEKMLGAMITLPLQLGRIRSGVREAEAGIRAAQAALRARKDDLAAQVVLQLYVARDSDRQAALFRTTLIPKAKEVVDAIRENMVAGNASYLEFLDAQRALLELRLDGIRMESMKVIAVARLEALCALDFGALGGSK